MLPTATVVRYVDELREGTTRPCLVTCLQVDGLKDEYVLKMRADVRASGLAFEYIAACLALHLQIEMPSPALVELPLAIALSQAHNPDLCDRLTRSAGLNFGTRYLTGLTTWTPDKRVPMNIAQKASEVIAFDALIDNVDRRRDKPNVLVGSGRVVVIDHEVAFGFLRLIGQPRTWIERLHFLRNHPFYEGIRGNFQALAGFKERLISLSDVEIDAICGSVPPSFGREHCDQIAAHLKLVRSDADRFIEGISGVLR